jgi:hypothetical protein
VASSSRPLVLNEGDAITDVEAARVLLRSILRRPELDAPFEELARALVRSPAARPSHAHGAAVLRQAVSQRLEAAPQDPELLRLLSNILEHETATSENRRAYASAGRLNPGAVWWPNPTSAEAPRSVYDELPYASVHPIVDRATPIGSAGSCFAMEIARRLRADGYNYVQTEASAYSCANWGPIFNAPAFRQLVEKAFGLRALPRLLWSQPAPGKPGDVELRDPFREEVVFASVEEYEADYDRHLAAAREALLRAEVFVITLGVNEVWYLKADGAVFSRNPWRLASSLVERRVLGVADNVRELQTMLDIWRAHNPGLRLIVSVSPVPLLATFRGGECHVVAASCHSKATLRVAAEEFVARNRNVYYFPSYETVLYCTERPWEPDQRHVSPEAVAKVMRLFATMFLKDGAPATALPAGAGPGTLASVAVPPASPAEAPAAVGPTAPAIAAEVAQLEYSLPLIEAISTRAARGHPRAGEVGGHLEAYMAGYRHFAATGVTPHEAYASMRALSVITDNRFNDAIRQVYATVHPPRALPDPRGVLGDMSGSGLTHVLGELEREGYAVLPGRVPADVCARLLEFALRAPAIPQSPPAASGTPVPYDRAHPVSLKYDFAEGELMRHPDVQRLMADASVLAVVQAALGCQPVLALAALWWSVPFLDHADSYAAQLYHFDMDQSNFLKVFVYLTDVTSVTGPHCFVRGSHRGRPLALRRDGRLADEEVARHYAPAEIVEITGPAGTVFVENTRGLHKGKHPTGGDRLIFQLCFAASLFGAPYGVVPLEGAVEPRLSQRMLALPRTYGRIVRP